MARQRTTFTVDTPEKFSGLNLRAEPSLRGQILSVLSDGEKVKIDTEAKAPTGWCALASGGYVMTRYLK